MAERTIGYIVAIREHGAWKDDWDGTVHPTRDAARLEAYEAKRLGYKAAVARLVINVEAFDGIMGAEADA